MNNTLSCWECLYFVPILAKGNHTGFGACHRFPPTITGGTLEPNPLGAWPVVAMDDFCGELAVKQSGEQG